MLNLAFALSAALAILTPTAPDEDCFDCGSGWFHYTSSGDVGYGNSGTSWQKACEEATRNLLEVMAGTVGHRCCECAATLRDCKRETEFTGGGTATTVWGGNQEDGFTCVATYSGTFKSKCRSCYSAGGGSGF